MTNQRIDFLGLPLNVGMTFEDVLQLLHQKGGARLVSFINPASWTTAKRNTEFRATLEKIPVILPDGEGVASACRCITGLPCQRISFDMSSLADPFFKAAIQEKTTLMLIGGVPNIDEQVHDKLKTAYPELKIIGTQHGYGDLTPKISVIMAQAPDAVIVGMGSPRQELFLLSLREAGYQGLAITCGGFFDQYLQDVNYYPKWINHWNLRFAWRLLKEPKRLWRRYLIDYQLFIWRALKALWQKWWPKAQAYAKDAAAKLRRE